MRLSYKNPARSAVRETVRKLTAVLLSAVLGAPVAWAQIQVATCTAPGGFGVGLPAAAPVPIETLKGVPNPVFPAYPDLTVVRDDLKQFIADQNAAIQLGKAFFWDIQAGSDNKTSCATCHYQAGSDARERNQLHPGSNKSWDSYGPNQSLKQVTFPFTVRSMRDSDNVAGSQGISSSTFLRIENGGVERTSPVTDPVFQNFRRVTPKHTPSTINSVFNHRNFWNGRAQPEFNGVDPFGSRSRQVVWSFTSSGGIAQTSILIQNASLASQAVGPPVNPVEMSAAGRKFPDIGRKLLDAKPLALQKVDPTDSVLGALADTASKGLKTTYRALIQKAFTPKFWNYTKKLPTGTYTMMEANFSLYWGLAVMLYEATLISDDSPMDRYLSSRVFRRNPLTNEVLVDPVSGLPLLAQPDNPVLLDGVVTRIATEFGITLQRDDLLAGLALFEMPPPAPPNPQSAYLGTVQPRGQGSFPIPEGSRQFGLQCVACHIGAELTTASVRNLAGAGVEPEHAAFRANGFDVRMERMFSRADWWETGPLTTVPLGIDSNGSLLGPTQATFDPSLYVVNVTGMPKVPSGYSLPLDVPVATYDVGWYDIGLRPLKWNGTQIDPEDAGLGGTDPSGIPLSWTAMHQNTGSAVKVPGVGLPCTGWHTANGFFNTPFPDEVLNAQGLPLISGPLRKTERTDVAGSFKVPGLRNVELSGPYFHTGGYSTLAQVIEFYDDAGNFDRDKNPSKSPLIVPLQLSPKQSDQLIAFLLSLTDERVRYEKAPFDHPELPLPNGVCPPESPNCSEVLLPAVGRSGLTKPLPRFLNKNPFEK